VFGPPAALFMAAIFVKGTAPLEALVGNFTSIPTAFVLGVVVLALLGNLWEETSWSAYVTARLQARYGPLRASLIVAPLFGLYHLPLFFIIGGLGDSPSHLPIVALFHASINATGGAAILTTFFAGVDGILVYAALAVLALIVIVATRGRLGLARTDAIAAQPLNVPQPAVGSSIA